MNASLHQHLHDLRGQGMKLRDIAKEIDLPGLKSASAIQGWLERPPQNEYPREEVYDVIWRQRQGGREEAYAPEPHEPATYDPPEAPRRLTVRTGSDFDALGLPDAPHRPAAEHAPSVRLHVVTQPATRSMAEAGQEAFGDLERTSSRYLDRQPVVPGLLEIDIETDAPVALCNMSDLHLGNKGTDHRRAREDAELIARTEGVYALFGGDGVDNFIKHASAMVSSTSCPEDEYAALEYYLGLFGGKLIGGVTGNHDYWTKGFSGIDYVRDIFRRLQVAYGRHTLRVLLRVNGIPYRIELRHTYRFKSSLNLSNQLQRMYDFSEWQWDIGMVGHTHDGPFCFPFQRHGAERWGGLAGSYKIVDDHSRQWGFNDAAATTPLFILGHERRTIEGVNDLRLGIERLSAIRARRKAA